MHHTIMPHCKVTNQLQGCSFTLLSADLESQANDLSLTRLFSALTFVCGKLTPLKLRVIVERNERCKWNRSILRVVHRLASYSPSALIVTYSCTGDALHVSLSSAPLTKNVMYESLNGSTYYSFAAIMSLDRLSRVPDREPAHEER